MLQRQLRRLWGWKLHDTFLLQVNFNQTRLWFNEPMKRNTKKEIVLKKNRNWLMWGARSFIQMTIVFSLNCNKSCSCCCCCCRCCEASISWCMNHCAYIIIYFLVKCFLNYATDKQERTVLLPLVCLPKKRKDYVSTTVSYPQWHLCNRWKSPHL